MKVLTLTALLLVSLSAYSFDNYVFNFGAGKTALWSNPMNWEGGVVPPTEVAKITIAPPDNSEGWVCLLDLDNFICYDTIRTKTNATFKILSGYTLRSSKNVFIESVAVLSVEGYLNVFCSNPGTDVIDNYGTLTVSGAIQNDPETLCLGFGFYNFMNYGPLYVYGTINLALAVISCGDLLYVTGSIHSGYRGSLAANGRFINSGTISGNLSLFVSSLDNNGIINLTGDDFFHSGMYVNGQLINRKSIHVEGELRLNGNIINKGSMEAANTCKVYFDSAHIINDSSIYIGEETSIIEPGKKSFFINNGSFTYLPNVDQTSYLDMDIINSGTFWVRGLQITNGSVINKKLFDVSATLDSTRIMVPFINLGTLNTFGPTVFSSAFINSGQINSN